METRSPAPTGSSPRLVAHTCELCVESLGGAGWLGSDCAAAPRGARLRIQNANKIRACIISLFSESLSFCLISAIAVKHNSHCPGEQVNIHPEGPVADIVRVVGDPFGIGRVIASGHLPESSQARNCLGIQGVGVFVFGYFKVHDGARTNQTHLAFDYVPELGQLIQAGLSERLPNSSDARVVSKFLVFGPLFLQFGAACQRTLQNFGRVPHHGSELPDMKSLAVES